ncbi:hypothetical protein HDV00_011830 [Rhizophlyctis rosea]|nr:hypothetical protein HDV00_011830 [Rhizophlyctis rosea]
MFYALLAGNLQVLEAGKRHLGHAVFSKSSNTFTVLGSLAERKVKKVGMPGGCTKDWSRHLHIPKEQLPYACEFVDVHRHLSRIGYDLGSTEEEVALILESKELFNGGVRALEKFNDLIILFRAVLGANYLQGEYEGDADLTLPLLLESLLAFLVTNPWTFRFLVETGTISSRTGGRDSGKVF